jgi:UPF0716 protein FxsA
MIAAPFIELWLLLRINESIGLSRTLMLVVGTGILGAILTKRQGINTLRKMNEQSARGEMPGAMMVDGIMILAAGLLLITPGVITDGVGFLLLVPLVRAGLRKRLAGAIKMRPMQMGPFPPGFDPTAQAGNAQPPVSNMADDTAHSADSNQASTPASDAVIDVEFEVHENP